ncbi:hypothetical protein BFAG_02311 [Bacteroides fragilis 3_1_12]|uniref:Uncharacterized protein n=1 Tax=Bacteroides fragilis 3_1_12 TaxID=457424 RepID=A0ABN0BKZ6_BACFG|nr:hypothetical protein BFAG_02311 [Bacteroides fragilis 3_1_12]
MAHRTVFRAAKHLGQIHSEVVLPVKEKHSLTKDFSLVGTGGPAPCRWALPDR